MATAVSTPVRPLNGSASLRLWHLLSLDAPTVAALWLCFLAHQFSVAQTAVVPVALALAVWLLYAGDRIYDSVRGEALQERHQYHFAHRTVFVSAAVAVALSLAGLMVVLPEYVRTAWLLLALPLGVYVVAVHLLQLPGVPKEPLVAIFFALATAVPLLQGSTISHTVLALIAASFGCLCWLNCAAIARWENTLGQSDRWTAWLGRHFILVGPALMLLSAPLLVIPHAAAVSLSIMAGAACLSLVDRYRFRLEKTTLRALADATLLTPIAVWPIFALLNLR